MTRLQISPALAAAAKHCALVEQIENCAPPVCAPYLRDAYDRMKLPVRVRVNGRGEITGHIDNAAIRERDIRGQTGFRTPGAMHATRAYFALVDTLTRSGQPPAETHRSPETAVELAPAFSSEPAALRHVSPPTAGTPDAAEPDAVPPLGGVGQPSGAA